MMLPKISCECGCTHWEYSDGFHECKKCPKKITDEEMLRLINQKLIKKSK